MNKLHITFQALGRRSRVLGGLGCHSEGPPTEVLTVTTWKERHSRMRWDTLKEIAFYIMIAVLLIFVVLGFLRPPITPHFPVPSRVPAPASSSLMLRLAQEQRTYPSYRNSPFSRSSTKSAKKENRKYIRKIL
jgi:hypothetical protein